MNRSLENPPPRLAARWSLALTLLGLLALAGGCLPERDVSQGAQLVLPRGWLGPTATFEVRFDEVAASAEAVGKTVGECPLQLTPAVEGAWTWLSQRSGEFTPAEPLRLATVYRARLRPGLKGPDGQPIRARLEKRLRTPSFGLMSWSPREGSTSAAADPEAFLFFNADVRAQAVGHRVYFQDAAGRRAAASVRQGTQLDRNAAYWLGGSGRTVTWTEQFQEGRPATAAMSSPTADNAETNLVANLLVVTPRQPLPVGAGWRLVLDRGLASAEEGLRMPATAEVAIGDVKPFVVVNTEARNLVRSGKRFSVFFSKELHRALTNEAALERWFEIVPRPANLVVEDHRHALIFRADYALGVPHTLTLRAGLPSAEPFTLEKPAVFGFTMEPIPPRLYFPATSASQLAAGRRDFPLLAVNVPRTRVRAKLLDPESVVHGLGGYEGYFKAWSEDIRYLEPFRGVDYRALPGRTVFEEQIETGAGVDESRTIALEWERMLRGRTAGVVLLEAERSDEDGSRRPRLGAQALIQVTDLGLVWKRSPHGLDVFVFSLDSGAGVAGAQVSLVSEENEPVAQAATDAQGLARLGTSEGAWVVARKGEDQHAVRKEADTLWPHGFGLPMAWGEEERSTRRVFLFSDREVYRPGETVHLKAIAREWGEGGLRIPAGLEGTLKCRDGRGRTFFETNVTLSASGAWQESILLPQGVRGHYLACLNLASNDYPLGFLVQDYQPAPFEVELKPKPAFAAGETPAAPLSARYFFGKPLSRARVQWSLRAGPLELSPEGFDGFAFSQAYVEGLGRHRAEWSTLQGEATLTDKTPLVLQPEISADPEAPGPQTVELLAEVTDLNQATVSKSAQFVCHSSAFYLGLRSVGDVVLAGQPLAVEAAAAGADGKPWPKPIAARLSLSRVQWQSVRVEVAGRYRAYRTEALVTNLLDREIVIQPGRLQRKGEGEFSLEGFRLEGLLASEAGAYLVELRASDENGHRTAASLLLHAAEKGQTGWDYQSETRMELLPDRKEYQAGQTAMILAKAPFAGRALVTVERERVLRSFVTNLVGNAPVLQVPLQAGDAPNVFVSVIALRGAADSPRQHKSPEYRAGYCSLKVEDPEARLSLRLEPSATQCLPGAEMRIAAAATLAGGAPAADAEITLWAVDEGVLSLTGFATPDPLPVFYEALRLAVFTSVSLPSLLSEAPEDRHFFNKGYRIGGGGAERIRTRFLPCAFWRATLRTGPDGRVETAFTAPDSVTSYRVMAVAHRGARQFGSGQARFTVSKPFLIEPALPRIANVTDRLLARAVVHNQGDHPARVQVKLELDDKARSTNGVLTQTLALAARGSAAVDFPIECVEAGAAKWIWRARAEAPEPFTDAVQSTLEVGRIEPLLREVYSTRTRAAQTNLLAGANPQLLEGHGTVAVVLATTRLSELGEGVAHLLHYPYGCAEQTASSLLPWVVLRDSPAGRFLNRPPAEIDRAIRSGVERLVNMQTASGGLGYWPGDREPVLWASAYGGLALALAARQPSFSAREELAKLAAYLSRELRGAATNSPAPHEHCLALCALAFAGRAEAAYHELLFQKRALLSSEDRALLALAILEAGGPSTMVRELLESSPAVAAWSDTWFGGPERELAARLLVWSRYQPSAAMVDRLVAELLASRRDGHWTTTQGNAWALLALSEYAARAEGKPLPAQGRLERGGRSIPFELTDQAPVFTCSFPIDPASAAQPLTLVNLSNATLCASVSVESRSRVAFQPRQDRAYSLQRDYARLDDENRPLDAAGARVGDRILVTLRLTVRQPAHYLAIDDPLPSVLEALNPEFRTQAARGPGQTTADSPGTRWRGDFHELRADRALFFGNHVAPGDYSIRYLARVRAAGQATAPAAKVEEMYHPERFGLAAPQALSTRPLE